MRREMRVERRELAQASMSGFRLIMIISIILHLQHIAYVCVRERGRGSESAHHI